MAQTIGINAEVTFENRPFVENLDSLRDVRRVVQVRLIFPGGRPTLTDGLKASILPNGARISALFRVNPVKPLVGFHK